MTNTLYVFIYIIEATIRDDVFTEAHSQKKTSNVHQAQ